MYVNISDLLKQIALGEDSVLELKAVEFSGNKVIGPHRDGMVLRSWRYAAPLVQTMPDNVLVEVAHDVTWWIETVSKSINQHEEILLNLCRRVLALPLEADTGMTLGGEPIDQPVTEALNHPVGHAASAL